MLTVSSRQVHAFRLQRHHLLEGKKPGFLTVCSDICGAQAQIMSSAYASLWARIPGITRAEITAAVCEKRTLVRTSLMRQTLHLVPATDFEIYIAALRPSRVAAVLRIMSRFGIDEKEANNLSGLLVDALSSGPLGHTALEEAVRPKASRRVRAWMDKVWSVLRIPIAEGRVCYGPERGHDATFVRTDQWLGERKPVPEAEAKQILLRRYLRAYGPATVRDFSFWAGMSMPEAKNVFSILASKLTEIDLNGVLCFLLQEDLPRFKQAKQTGCVRLLPAFDAYLLAHSVKDHLVEARHYKRVYRNQGWISPVVLINGEIAGTWSHRINKGRLQVDLQPFTKFTSDARKKIEEEIARLEKFMQSAQ
ncbi:MAG TPA: winged helix DNA-binding domain-containing protein [Candidatus Angelobacter sp.]|nr:winged helix DNA-binding domain-containing protein [Candidatus Angelobacter sp.]